MNNLNNRNQKLILNLIYIIFVFSLLYIIGLSIGIRLKLTLFMQISISIIGSLIVKFFLLNPLVLYILLVLGFIVLVIIHKYYFPILLLVAERTYLLFNNIFNNLKGDEYIKAENLLLFWGLLLVLISFYTAIIIFKNKSIFYLIPVYIPTFLYYWYIFYDEAYIMIVLFLLAFILLMGLYRYSKSFNIFKKNKENFERLYYPWIKTITIYSIIIVSLALILPKNNKFIHWPWLQKLVYEKFPNIEDLRSYDVYRRDTGETTLFNFSATGFQENSSRLGGPVKLSSQKVMIVQGEDVNYLRGNVKHTYTGNSWQGLILDSTKYKSGQRFRGLPFKDRDKKFKEQYITITNLSFASTTIFSPYIPESVSINGNDSVYVTSDSTIYMPKGVYEGESYTLRVQEPKPYGVLMAYGMDNNKEDIDNIEIFLQIPEDKITRRTKDLVRDIVFEANTDYEKAVAVESYLRENYKYNLDVSEVPENQEFIDYFLFREKEGYCTYYASAMAIMLRLEGIPTRYVEGFILHEQSEPGVYVIKHENAHAWVEAFIEPVGWMTFEPTPAYGVQPRMEDYVIEDIEEDVLDNISNNYEEIIIDEENRPVPNDIDTNESEIIQGEEDSIKDNTKKESTIGYIIIILLLMILPFRFLIGFIYFWYKEYQGNKLTNNKKAIYLYKQILKLTELFGSPQVYGETHYEYAHRVANKFYYQRENGIKEITDIFVKSKYGSWETSDKDLLEMERFRTYLDKHLRNNWGYVVYYYRKYAKIGYMRG